MDKTSEKPKVTLPLIKDDFDEQIQSITSKIENIDNSSPELVKLLFERMKLYRKVNKYELSNSDSNEILSYIRRNNKESKPENLNYINFNNKFVRDVLLEKIRSYKSMCKYDIALEICELILKRDKNNVDTLIEKADLLQKKFDIKQCLEYLDRILKINNKNTFALNIKIKCLLKTTGRPNDNELKKSLFDEVLKIGGIQDTSFWGNYAYYYITCVKDHEKALKVLSESIEKWPRSAEFYSLYGLEYALTGDFDLAEFYCRKAISVDRYCRNSFVFLGYIHFRREDVDTSIILQKHALEIDSFLINANMQLANCYGIKNEFDEALKRYQIALSIHPRAEIYAKIGLLFHTRKRNFDKAQEFYKKAIEVDPRCAIAYSSFGALYFQKDKENGYKKSEEYLRKAIEIDPTIRKPHHNLGILYKVQNKYKIAIKHFTKAIKVDKGYKLAVEKCLECYTSLITLPGKEELFTSKFECFNVFVEILEVLRATDRVIACTSYRKCGHTLFLYLRNALSEFERKRIEDFNSEESVFKIRVKDGNYFKLPNIFKKIFKFSKSKGETLDLDYSMSETVFLKALKLIKGEEIDISSLDESHEICNFFQHFGLTVHLLYCLSFLNEISSENAFSWGFGGPQKKTKESVTRSIFKIGSKVNVTEKIIEFMSIIVKKESIDSVFYYKCMLILHGYYCFNLAKSMFHFDDSIPDISQYVNPDEQEFLGWVDKYFEKLPKEKKKLLEFVTNYKFNMMNHHQRLFEHDYFKKIKNEQSQEYDNIVEMLDFECYGNISAEKIFNKYLGESIYPFVEDSSDTTCNLIMSLPTNESTQAHREILAIRSEYFATLLYSESFVESSQKNIKITNIHSLKVLNAIVKFLYTKKVDFINFNDIELLHFKQIADMIVLFELKMNIDIEIWKRESDYNTFLESCKIAEQQEKSGFEFKGIK